MVRAGLFNGHFLHTFSLVAAPVPVLALALWLVHGLMPDLDVKPSRSLQPLERTA